MMAKSQIPKKSLKLAPILALTLLLTIPLLYLSFIGNSSHHKLPSHVSTAPQPTNSYPCSAADARRPCSGGDPTLHRLDHAVGGGGECDLFTGDWVPDPNGPYYTNETCDAIQEHQNCMKFGRPDTGYLKWRWRPDACELPPFDPTLFLEMVRGKSLAFVGDSVARNHMQSLICLLSRVSLFINFVNY